MENVGTRKQFDDLGLTRSEERVLRHVTGLAYSEPKGRVERIFYGPLKPSLEVLVALIVLAVFLVALSYVAWSFADVAKAISFPFMLVAFSVVMSRRDLLIKKLYRALEDERGRRAVQSSHSVP